MKIAIVGATGEVGRMMIKCLEEFELPVSSLELFASQRSVGNQLFFNDKAHTVQLLDNAAMLRHQDYVLFSAGAGVARSYAPLAAEASELVIDNSSAFRRDENIPLVVPEVNGDLLSGYSGIVANPNCSTIQIIIPLAVLDKLYGLKKVIVSTYQSVSGSGNSGIQILNMQRRGSSEKGIYPEIIDLNVIPQIGGFLDDGYSQEEDKMHQEARKILRHEEIEISCTCVRVPVIYGHSASVYAEFEREIELSEAEFALAAAESSVFYPNTYMTPLELGSSNDTHTSRLRYGVDRKSLTFWNVGHNVRIGAAANAVRILKRHASDTGRL